MFFLCVCVTASDGDIAASAQNRSLKMLRTGWQRVQQAFLRLHQRPFSMETMILSSSSKMFPKLANELLQTQSDGGHGGARRISLLLERMARLGVREVQLPSVNRLLQALVKPAASLPSAVICEIFSSMRHLRCRFNIHRPLSNALARSLLEQMETITPRKIPNLMGDLVKLNLDSHPLFEV